MRTLLFLCVFSLILLPFLLSKPLSPKKVVTAINCGSSTAAKSNLGFTYQADKGFSGGRTADYSVNPEASGATMKFTRDPHIYFSERHDDVSLRYDIEVPRAGNYVLILKFSEMKFTEKNQRVFHVKLGEQRVKENVDPAGTVGRYAALDEYIAFELRNDMVYANGQFCAGAYNPANKKLRFELEKTDRDNPMIMGIVLYEGTLEDTDFYEIPQMRQDWEKKLLEEKRKKEEEKLRKEAAKLKKREKVKVRNDQTEDFEDDFDDAFDAVESSDKGVLSLLTSPTGLFVTFSSLIGLAVIFFMNKGSLGSALKASEPLTSEEAKVKPAPAKAQNKPKKK